MVITSVVGVHSIAYKQLAQGSFCTEVCFGTLQNIAGGYIYLLIIFIYIYLSIHLIYLLIKHFLQFNAGYIIDVVLCGSVSREWRLQLHDCEFGSHWRHPYENVCTNYCKYIYC